MAAVWCSPLAASVLVAGLLEDHTADDIRRLVDINVTGSALTARTALKIFRSQDHGVLILVSSLLGVVPSPLVPVYVMSKFAIRGLALSLRQSLVGHRDIAVCAVLPGPVDTPMFQRAANRTGRELRAIPPAIAPQRLAAAIVSCARRPRRQATAGVLAHGILVSHHVAPRLTEFLVAQYSARTVLQDTDAAPSDGALHVPRAAAVSGGWRRGEMRRRLGERMGAFLGR